MTILSRGTNGIERRVVIEEAVPGEASESVVIDEVGGEGKTDAELAETVEHIFSKPDIDDDYEPLQSSKSNGDYLAYPAQSASFKSEKISSNPILSDEKRRLLINHWRNTLDDDSEIIIGEYQLPAENTPLGISVETVASVDMKGDQLDFRHRIVGLKEDGVIAKQTDLKEEDEIIETRRHEFKFQSDWPLEGINE
ncbi:unnamed protein product [Rodentolepis nana]|uniref:MJ1316 domain-containing protein n=1 Tax=Rodentolepis nana TaxID=102285 RepID=A0A0R3TTW5_RODNA|nr:unnamed protein product [Rodentolepis nana]